MAEQRIAPGASEPSIRFYAWRSDAPVAINSSEPGLSIGWRQSLRGVPLGTSFTALALSDLAAVNSAHSPGGLIVVDSSIGEHRLDLPAAAAIDSPADVIDLQMSATDSDLLLFVKGVIMITSARFQTEARIIISEND